jgi:glutaredoxin-like YruB-family protein
MMAKKVKVYSAVWCPWCKKAKEWLAANKVPFVEVDVEKDPKAAEEMVKKTGQTGIPVIEIDGEAIVGFDVDRMKKALKLK